MSSRRGERPSSAWTTSRASKPCRGDTQPSRCVPATRPGSSSSIDGTRNVFAAFNIRTGGVVVQVTKDRKVPDVLAFLDLLRHRYPRGPVILITDNINTRRG